MANVHASEQTSSHISRRLWIGISSSIVVTMLVGVVNQRGLLRFAVRSLGLHLDAGYTVRYVVPDGYRGVFTVSEDCEHGSQPEAGNHGEVIYRIPDSGHLVTTDVTPLMTLHKCEAMFRNGEFIGIEGDPSEIRLRGLTGFDSDGKSRTLIGTHQEANDWWSDRKDWFKKIGP